MEPNQIPPPQPARLTDAAIAQAVQGGAVYAVKNYDRNLAYADRAGYRNAVRPGALFCGEEINMTRNFNLPPGCSDKDIEENADPKKHCQDCGRILWGNEETICKRCCDADEDNE